MTALVGSDAVMKALENIARRMGGGSVSVGFMGGATYPDGTPIAAVAFWNEFGVPSHNQPPRPFFRRMIADKSSDWPKTMAAQMCVQNFDGEKVLTIMGEEIKGQLTESITEFREPKLAQSTIDAKGFDKPLIHSGDMMRSIDYEVSQ